MLQRRLAESQPPAPPPDCSPPFLVDGILCRTVSNANAQTEIQEWSGSYWQPSMVPMYRLVDRRAAPRDLLAARGVPTADWAGHPPRHWDTPQLVQLSRDVLPPGAALPTDGKTPKAE